MKNLIYIMAIFSKPNMKTSIASKDACTIRNPHSLIRITTIYIIPMVSIISIVSIVVIISIVFIVFIVPIPFYIIQSKIGGRFRVSSEHVAYPYHMPQ